MLLDYLRQKINPQNPLLLWYHHAMAFFAAAIYGFPAKNMSVIAVTGTSGKSTTVSLIASIFETWQQHNQAVLSGVGVLSSMLVKTGKRTFENDTKMTSFSRFRLNQFLREMKQSGLKTVVMEVTSHALSQHRLSGIPINAAVLTNVSGDHIEYHGGFEAYLEAKAKLFKLLYETRPHRSLRVLPKDDPNISYFEKLPAQTKISFGLSSENLENLPENSIFASDIKYFPDSTNFILHYGSKQAAITFKLPGKTNVLNALAAASVAYGFHVPLEVVKRGLEKISSMPGRYESVRCSDDQNFSIIVDYAHTPKALEELCSFYRPLAAAKLIIVFGATGGGRDKSKRPIMGEVVSKYCDIVIVTDDDPYEEDRWEIIEQVASGVKNKREGKNFFKILGRREAIQKALSLSEKGDILLIAGKGCEKIWIVGKEKITWDDREVVCEALRTKRP